MRADGTADYLPMPLGPLIGAWADVVFTTTTIRLNPADTLLLFTDGLTEARAPATEARAPATEARAPATEARAPATEARAPTTDPSERYGDEALRAFVSELAPTTATAAVTAIIALLDSLGDGRQDDTAVLALGARTADNPMPSA
jgi:sigma-B regulation protein RsbU (phosphoserine phosphatase)